MEATGEKRERGDKLILSFSVTDERNQLFFPLSRRREE